MNYYFSEPSTLASPYFLLQYLTMFSHCSLKHLFQLWNIFARGGKEVNSRDYSLCPIWYVTMLACISLLVYLMSFPSVAHFVFHVFLNNCLDIEIMFCFVLSFRRLPLLKYLINHF